MDATVFIVDDDPAVRTSLKKLIDSVGLPAKTFESAEAFLATHQKDAPGCLILDVRMSGMSGLHLQEQLAAKEIFLPIIFITGYADVPMAVRAMSQGAVDFIEKPFRAQDLLDRVHRALRLDEQYRRDIQLRLAAEQRIALLTPREKQVMDLVVDGKLNKQIASALGVSEKTIEVHRSHVMRKLQVNNVAELVRFIVLFRKPNAKRPTLPPGKESQKPQDGGSSALRDTPPPARDDSRTPEAG